MTTDVALHASLHRRQLDLLETLAPRRAEILGDQEHRVHPGYRFPWRIAEGPALVPQSLFDRDVAAMRELVAWYFSPTFRARYRDACPERFRRQDDGGWFPRFIATDFTRVFDPRRGFGWCVPEIQSFPGNTLLKPHLLASLVGRLPFVGERDVSLLFGGATFAEHVAFLAREILGGAPPSDAAIVEIRPLEQKTVVDMLLYVKHLGVRLVGLEDLRVDPVSGIASYRRAVVFEDGRPVVREFARPEPLRIALSRCLPEEILEEEAKGRLERATVDAFFRTTTQRGTVRFVVHPQDFFVLCKSTLVGNPRHFPPLRPLDATLLATLEREGIAVDRGVVKPASSAGGKGLAGLGNALTRERLRELAQESERAGVPLLWQERYGCDPFDRASIGGFVPASSEERDPVYHELRLMWWTRPIPGGAPHEVELELLTGMTRWSRVGVPANAGRQKTPFTGTHGILVDRR